MKKALIFIMSLLMVFTLAACGKGASQTSSTNQPSKSGDTSSPAPESTEPTEAAHPKAKAVFS